MLGKKLLFTSVILLFFLNLSACQNAEVKGVDKFKVMADAVFWQKSQSDSKPWQRDFVQGLGQWQGDAAGEFDGDAWRITATQLHTSAYVQWNKPLADVFLGYRFKLSSLGEVSWQLPGLHSNVPSGENIWWMHLETTPMVDGRFGVQLVRFMQDEGKAIASPLVAFERTNLNWDAEQKDLKPLVFEKDTWYDISIHLLTNSPKRYDGLLQVEVNNRPALQKTFLRWRDDLQASIGQLTWVKNLQQDHQAWLALDDFRLSTKILAKLPGKNAP